jgi:co-chaperonin GroES (HSP10)
MTAKTSQLVNYEPREKSAAEAFLPRPMGYKVLLAVPTVGEKTGAGVYLPPDLRKREETASVVGHVVSLGPDAYSDASKFPNGAWCKEGDWVMFRSYAGTRFKVNGAEYRMVNDDTIEAVVDDPRYIERA